MKSKEQIKAKNEINKILKKYNMRLYTIIDPDSERIKTFVTDSQYEAENELAKFDQGTMDYVKKVF